MKLRKNSAYKKCPRCGNKCLLAQEKCEECDLVFSRLQYASNKAARKKIRKFDTDFVIQTTQLPPDIKWWKLLLLACLTGIMGGHYYYVGKYVKGGLMSVVFVYLVFLAFFNPYFTNNYYYIPVGIAAFAWIVSLVYVSVKKFKVPVIIDVEKMREGEVA